MEQQSIPQRVVESLARVVVTALATFWLSPSLLDD